MHDRSLNPSFSLSIKTVILLMKTISISSSFHTQHFTVPKDRGKAFCMVVLQSTVRKQNNLMTSVTLLDELPSRTPFLQSSIQVKTDNKRHLRYKFFIKHRESKYGIVLYFDVYFYIQFYDDCILNLFLFDFNFYNNTFKLNNSFHELFIDLQNTILKYST